MAATITYDDGSGQTDTNPTAFTIDDSWLPGLEAFRQAIRNPDSSVKYASIPEMLLGLLNDSITAAVVQAAPPPDMVAAQQAVETVQAAQRSTMQAAVSRGIAQRATPATPASPAQPAPIQTGS